MANFTPGPWITDETTETEPYYNVESETAEWIVARVWADVAELSSTGQARANASLIAAAPEMYAFITREYAETLCICKFSEWTGAKCTHCEAGSIIAKADGKAGA